MNRLSLYTRTGMTASEINAIKARLAQEQIRSGIDALKEIYAEEHGVQVDEVNLRAGIRCTISGKPDSKEFALNVKEPRTHVKHTK